MKGFPTSAMTSHISSKNLPPVLNHGLKNNEKLAGLSYLSHTAEHVGVPVGFWH